LNLATFGWSGVDETVARAFAAATGLASGDLDSRLVHFVANHRPKMSAGWVSRFSTEEDVISSAITYADAIVVIGGGFWTQSFVLRASKAEIPVLPLADTADKGAIAART